MSIYVPAVFVEPLGYQPAEFLDILPMRELVEGQLSTRSDASLVRTCADGPDGHIASAFGPGTSASGRQLPQGSPGRDASFTRAGRRLCGAPVGS